MNTQNHVDSAVPIHRCRARILTASCLQICTICGICISNKSNTVFLRPESFSAVNFYGGDPDQILKIMIARQDNHRYYNTSLPSKEERLMIIEWMESLAAMLEFKKQTFYTACAIMDAIISMAHIESHTLKMVAFVCMNLAGKMEEPCKQLPNFKNVVKLFQNTFTFEDFTNCEQVVFSMLGCSLNIQTPYNFASYFVYRGAIISEEVSDGSSNKILTDFEELLEFFMRISLDCYDLYQFSALTVGASLIACARKYAGLDVYWPEHLITLVGISWKSIKSCFDLIDKFAMTIYNEELNNRAAANNSAYYNFGTSEILCDKQSDIQTQVNSSRCSVVITEFECINSDDENLFGDDQTVVLKFNV